MRLVASLAVVVGILLLLARVVGKRFAGQAGAPVQVLHRQPLSRSSSVAVVSVGSRILVVGTTDHQVQLLTELDPEDLEPELGRAVLVGEPVDEQVEGPVVDSPVVGPVGQDVPELVRRAGAHRAEATRRPVHQGSLTGSVLSIDTWRQAMAAATGKAS